MAEDPMELVRKRDAELRHEAIVTQLGRIVQLQDLLESMLNIYADIGDPGRDELSEAMERVLEGVLAKLRAREDVAWPPTNEVVEGLPEDPFA
jgi:hypothetical protein